MFKFVSKQKRERWVLSTREILSNNIFADFHIEMNSNKEITLQGNISVYEYKDDYVKLRIKNGYIIIYGKNFDIINFEDETITFKGNIGSLEFEI